jgi:hypothetical protein
MREIKFRAWDGISKKMWHNVTFDACHIYGEYSDELEGPNGTMPRWDTNPLMQFTGLRDKTGKEIWEGDILGGIYQSPIKWCDKCKQFQLTSEVFGCMACLGDVHWSEIVADETVEVIGNIHDNPELLEAK